MFLYGVHLAEHKKLIFALTSIRGIGIKKSIKICAALGLGKEFFVHQLSDKQISQISNYIEKNIIIQGDLKKEQQFNISRLISISSYRGMRHTQGLPVRGQRTHSNARTYKGIYKK